MDLTTSPVVPLTLVAAVLAAQLILARRLVPALGLLVGTQAVFWILAFVLRPAYLMVFKPTLIPELADKRLMWTQYDFALGQVLWLCLLGQAVYFGILILFYWRTRRKVRTESAGFARSDSIYEIVLIALILWLVGWVGRLGAALDFGSLDSAFRIFGTVGGALLISTVRVKRRDASIWLVGLLVAIEEAWAFYYGSKAAMVVPLLALCLRWLLTDKPGAFGRRVVVLGLLAIVGFLIIQPMRGISTAERVAASADGEHPEIKGAAVSLLERFDGLSAVTDAAFLGPGTWMTAGEFASRIVVNMTPTGPIAAKSLSIGQQWTQEVRAESNANQVMDVPLAAGPTAEGFALSGPAGIILENVVLAAFTLAVGCAIQSRKTIPTLFAATFAFSTVLFEQGILGLAATTNKALQIAIIGFVLVVIIRSGTSKRYIKRNVHVSQGSHSIGRGGN
jgi:hypothetical protein